jgi:MoxR-like ATPase
MQASSFDQFTGTEQYIVSADLRDAVNVAIALQRPLLVKGEPGTGKTLLAHNIARALGKPLLVWNIKSTTKAKDGLYIYDTVQRLNDARFGDGDVSDIKRYIRLGCLGQAFTADEQVVLLIDEIDKADIEFPNDLLNELDEMNFYILETDERIVAHQRPIVIITSNAEKELPDAFLRRCVFHYIAFPRTAT